MSNVLTHTAWLKWMFLRQANYAEAVSRKAYVAYCAWLSGKIIARLKRLLKQANMEILIPYFFFFFKLSSFLLLGFLSSIYRTILSFDELEIDKLR